MKKLFWIFTIKKRIKDIITLLEQEAARNELILKKYYDSPKTLTDSKDILDIFYLRQRVSINKEIIIFLKLL